MWDLCSSKFSTNNTIINTFNALNLAVPCGTVYIVLFIITIYLIYFNKGPVFLYLDLLLQETILVVDKFCASSWIKNLFCSQILLQDVEWLGMSSLIIFFL